MKSLALKFLGIGSTLWKFLLPIIKSEARNVLNDLLPMAKEIVVEVAKTHDLPNARRDAAVRLLRDRAWGAGFSVSTSLLNLAIELAVQAAKNQD